MIRNRNLTVESLEGKMLLTATAVPVPISLLPAPEIAIVQPQPSTPGTGFTPVGSIQADPTSPA